MKKSLGFKFLLLNVSLILSFSGVKAVTFAENENMENLYRSDLENGKKQLGEEQSRIFRSNFEKEHADLLRKKDSYYKQAKVLYLELLDFIDKYKKSGKSFGQYVADFMKSDGSGSIKIIDKNERDNLLKEGANYRRLWLGTKNLDYAKKIKTGDEVVENDDLKGDWIINKMNGGLGHGVLLKSSESVALRDGLNIVEFAVDTSKLKVISKNDLENIRLLMFYVYPDMIDFAKIYNSAIPIDSYYSQRFSSLNDALKNRFDVDAFSILKKLQEIYPDDERYSNLEYARYTLADFFSNNCKDSVISDEFLEKSKDKQHGYCNDLYASSVDYGLLARLLGFDAVVDDYSSVDLTKKQDGAQQNRFYLIVNPGVLNVFAGENEKPRSIKQQFDLIFENKEIDAAEGKNEPETVNEVLAESLTDEEIKRFRADYSAYLCKKKLIESPTLEELAKNPELVAASEKLYEALVKWVDECEASPMGFSTYVYNYLKGDCEKLNVLKADEFDKYCNSSESILKLYRGITNSKYVQEFRNGQIYMGGTYTGWLNEKNLTAGLQLGNGIYTTVGKADAIAYSTFWGSDGDEKKAAVGDVVEMAVDLSKVKVIKLLDLRILRSLMVYNHPEMFDFAKVFNSLIKEDFYCSRMFGYLATAIKKVWGVDVLNLASIVKPGYEHLPIEEKIKLGENIAYFLTKFCFSSEVKQEFERITANVQPCLSNNLFAGWLNHGFLARLLGYDVIEDKHDVKNVVVVDGNVESSKTNLMDDFYVIVNPKVLTVCGDARPKPTTLKEHVDRLHNRS